MRTAANAPCYVSFAAYASEQAQTTQRLVVNRDISGRAWTSTVTVGGRPVAPENTVGRVTATPAGGSRNPMFDGTMAQTMAGGQSNPMFGNTAYGATVARPSSGTKRRPSPETQGQRVLGGNVRFGNASADDEEPAPARGVRFHSADGSAAGGGGGGGGGRPPTGGNSNPMFDSTMARGTMKGAFGNNASYERTMARQGGEESEMAGFGGGGGARNPMYDSTMARTGRPAQQLSEPAAAEPASAGAGSGAEASPTYSRFLDFKSMLTGRMAAPAAAPEPTPAPAAAAGGRPKFSDGLRSPERERPALNKKWVRRTAPEADGAGASSELPEGVSSPGALRKLRVAAPPGPDPLSATGFFSSMFPGEPGRKMDLGSPTPASTPTAKSYASRLEDIRARASAATRMQAPPTVRHAATDGDEDVSPLPCSHRIPDSGLP